VGTFWTSSRALAYASSLVLAAGLLNACDLNPQPTPPKRTGTDEPASANATTSSTGGIVPGFTSTTSTTGGSTLTTGSPIIDGEDDGSGAMDPDEGMQLPSGPEGGGGGAAGAAGAGTDEALPPPTNSPH